MLRAQEETYTRDVECDALKSHTCSLHACRDLSHLTPASKEPKRTKRNGEKNVIKGMAAMQGASIMSIDKDNVLMSIRNKR